MIPSKTASNPNERKIDYSTNVEKVIVIVEIKFWRLTFNENLVTEIKGQWDNKRSHCIHYVRVL